MTDQLDQTAAPTKDELEREKLALEIKYVRRTFAVQVLNVIVIVGVAAAGFIFFQSRQLDHMTEARAALELQHVENTLVGVFNLKSDADKRLMLESLQQQHPRFEFLRSLANSFDPVAKTSNPQSPLIPPGPPGKETSRAQSCSGLLSELSEAVARLSDLDASLKEEIGIASISSLIRPGKGPIYRSLVQRSDAVREKKADLEKRMKDLKC